MKIIYIIALINLPGFHIVSSQSQQQVQPQPLGQKSDVQQFPYRSAPTFLGQMIANLINYKLRWISTLAERLAGNSTGRPSPYTTLSTNMAMPASINSIPITHIGIPNAQHTSPNTAHQKSPQETLGEHVSPQMHSSHPTPDSAQPLHSPQTSSKAHAFPQMHSSPPTPHSTQPLHSPQSSSKAHASPQMHSLPPTLHSTQPLHSPQTTSKVHTSPQMHSLPSTPHSEQPLHSPQINSEAQDSDQTHSVPFTPHSAQAQPLHSLETSSEVDVPLQMATPTSSPLFAQPLHSPQTSTGSLVSPQMHSSPPTPHSSQPFHSPQTTLESQVPPEMHASPSKSPTSSVPISENSLEPTLVPDSLLPIESPASPQVISSNTFPAEQMPPPVVSPNSLSASISEPGFSNAPEVSSDPNPVSVSGALELVPEQPTPLSALQPPTQSALDWY